MNPAPKSTPAPDDEEFDSCRRCGDEHPVGVLEDDLCPGCCDEDD